ncbi:hypothetical protein C0989_008452, partial [Termitomyces sp. Mn162]
MRWIEDVLLYHFTLRHVPGKTFSVDGLSRRIKQPGDEEYQSVNPELVDEPKSMKFEYPDRDNGVPEWQKKKPLELWEFETEIDTRGGYLCGVAQEESDFTQELHQAHWQEQTLRKAIIGKLQADKLDPVAVLSLTMPLLPAESEEE